MMKFFATCVLSTLIFLGCSKQEDPSLTIYDLDSFANRFDGKILNGNVFIKETSNNEVLVKVSPETTENALHLVLANIGENRKHLNYNLGKAKILLLRDIVIIESKGLGYINLINNSEEVSSVFYTLKDSLDFEINNTNSYVGYGLSTFKGNSIKTKLSDKQEIESAFQYLFPESPNLRVSSECQSGGRGATSCSITENIGPIEQSCTVTCGQGYYACCKENVICQCVSEGGGGSECNDTDEHCIQPRYDY